MKMICLSILLCNVFFANSQTGAGTYKSNGYRDCSWNETSNKFVDCKIEWQDATFVISQKQITVTAASYIVYTVISQNTEVADGETDIYYVVKDASGSFLQFRLNIAKLKLLYVVACDEDGEPIFYNNKASIKEWAINF